MVLTACQDPEASEPDDNKDASAEGLQASSGGPKDDDASSKHSEEGADSPQKIVPDKQDQGKPQSETRACDIDFLFVIDNSRSMSSRQKSLASSVPKFVDTMVKELDHKVDFHLGVVTTDAYEGNPSACRKLGALVTSTKGDDSSKAACGPYGEGRAYMIRKDPIGEKFPCAARPGVTGALTEKPIDAIRGALAPEMQKAGACNEGFLRKDAILVTVIITDEDDGLAGGILGSPGEPETWHKEVMAFKDNDERKVVMLGLVGQAAPNACKDSVNLGVESKRIKDFMKRFKHQITADVCESDYDPFFEKALSMIDVVCEEVAAPR